ncbi:MAG: hypothetical protein CL908_03395 [Deltaproteobacteria bacterium]|nr:hypothetical protein [Deltaproteobacteria bacterium]
MPGPLSGIRIIDASAVVSGPLAAMVLADQGADVIKVEPPGRGDSTRQKINARAGMTGLFVNNNRGKRSIVIDMKSEPGLQIMYDLIRGADVFIQNWRPGAAERLGLGESALRDLNEALIYTSITGYGESGPYRDDRVYDPIVQALTGFVALQKNPEFPIHDLVRTLVCDKSTAYTVAQAVSAALFARERGSGGQHIKVSMLDAALAFMWPDGMVDRTLLGDDIHSPFRVTDAYRIWDTADGQLIYFTNTLQEIHAVFAALGHPEWAEEEQFAAGAIMQPESREEMGQRIMREFQRFTTEELVRRLKEHDVPVAAANSLDEISRDPQIRHNQTIFEAVHPVYGRYQQARPAPQFSVTATEPAIPAPLLGEHTDSILSELGYDEARRAALREAGIAL